MWSAVGLLPEQAFSGRLAVAAREQIGEVSDVSALAIIHIHKCQHLI